MLHPGSGSASKNWAPERFAGLGQRLGEQLGAAPLVVGGPADGAALEAFDRVAGYSFPRLIERPLIELAALLAGCDLYVGNDSGISHLAGLCGAPSLVLFGPTDPRLWRPLGPRVDVLRADLAQLPVERVADVARAILARGQSDGS